MTQDGPGPDPLVAAIARLTADYDAAMPGRIADLRLSLDEARAGSPGGAARLVHDLHRLAGNAGTFGHPEVSERARELELRLEGPAAADGSAPADAGGGAGGVATALDEVAAFVDGLAARFPVG